MLSHSVLAVGLVSVNDQQWSASAVRKVLHTFAYGGAATDQQINNWATMAPDWAIQQMLTFAAVNPQLSPDINMAATYTVTYDATDAAGNAATQVSRTVIVNAKTACDNLRCKEAVYKVKKDRLLVEVKTSDKSARRTMRLTMDMDGNGIFERDIGIILLERGNRNTYRGVFRPFTNPNPTRASRIKVTSDLGGMCKGLDTLSTELQPLGANDDIVYAFSTDFGRQPGANGDFGTDHRRGNYMILVGNSVNGGLYGEMFPGSEIQGLANASRFDQAGSDIEGLSSFERVLAAACDWVEPGTAPQVFPSAAVSPVEAGVDLSMLFTPGGIA